MDNKPNTSSKPLKDVVFERIECEHLCPKSRWFFLAREVFFWSFWFLSVLIGALAVAVSLFILIHRHYELYEATHRNALTFLVEVLPYLWIVAFGLMVFVSIFNFRHTKYGYRYALWLVISSNIVFSFALGSALQFFGLGYTIDSILGANMVNYVSQDKLDYKFWQTPDEGRLLGRQMIDIETSSSTVFFEDMTGERWQIHVTELLPEDIELLASKKPVRILGKCIDKESQVFLACGVFPWMLQKDITIDELLIERQRFETRLVDYRSSNHSKVNNRESNDFPEINKKDACLGLLTI